VIAIVDYGRGNLYSLSRALHQVGAVHEVTADSDKILAASGVVLPGVGAFRDAMARLGERELVAPVRAAAACGTPLLGICLGMQLLFTRSTEFGEHLGLDLIRGTVDRLPRGDAGPSQTRIPNVGWRLVTPRAKHPLSDALGAGEMVYFVHSYIPYPEDPRDIFATIPFNGIEAAVLVGRGNVTGCQFHPEKSGPVGLRILEAFVNAVEQARPARTSAGAA